jgi:hypothetical protein
MAERRRRRAEIFSIVHDGQLTKAEALQALRVAAQAATEALPAALAQCRTDSERQTVQGDRDIVMLAHLNSLQKTLIQTGTLFEKMAADLEQEAGNVRNKATTLQNISEAINLFADLVRLAGSLALAFA